MSIGTTPRVAVIVPNYNGARYLEECLSSLLAQGYRDRRVIVVDNASSDGSAEMVERRFPQVDLVRNPVNTGFAGGCNTGLRRGLEQGAEYLVLVNSDTRAEPDWLEELVAAADTDPCIGLCQSLILLASRPNVINTAGNESHYLAFGYCGRYLEEDRGVPGGVREIPFASGTAVLARRRMLEEVGLMDEDLFLYQEDLDLSWRARLAGWRVVLAPRSRIHHHYHFDRNREKFYYLERNRLLVSIKNYAPRSLVVLAPAFLGAELAMVGYAFASGWGPRKLAGYRDLWRQRRRIAAKRRRVQATRRVPDRSIAANWTDRMEFPGFRESPLARLANPVSHAYWRLARRLL